MTVRLSRRYEFFASHRLHAPAMTDAENVAAYGKCNNPHGHGHNYEVELTVRGEVDSVTGRVVDLSLLDLIAEEQILAPFRYRNLNEEVAAFRTIVPTTENLGVEVDRRLRAVWAKTFAPIEPGALHLEKVRIWETERNICEIAGY
jgi:6-pyruvoyltetrahydropterin/6-carboxytetrahydropterin synthase